MKKDGKSREKAGKGRVTAGSNKELKNKTVQLQELNSALKVLLKKRDEDRIELEEKMVSNVRELAFPYLAKF